MDAVDKLGEAFRNSQQDRKELGTGCRPDHSCNTCLKRWEEIGGSSDYKLESADVCRFAVMVPMISNRIDDENWSMRFVDSTWCWWVSGSYDNSSHCCMDLLHKKEEESLPAGKDESDDSVSKHSGSLKISMKEIYSATNYFNTSNFIGQGIAGKVYEGTLSNGLRVAVKHIVNDGQIETFVREVRSLSHITHPNLVALLGYCENEDECFLVYEQCHHGNLSEWLYGKDKVLSWIQRLKIAIDRARGLWFLHTYQEAALFIAISRYVQDQGIHYFLTAFNHLSSLILHMMVFWQPTNILINDKFQAKLADFGLSKVTDIGQSHVNSEFRGTFGYVDPEYRRNHRVNDSGHVYSFGMVLLQLLSGERVLNLNLHRPLPPSKKSTRGGDTAKFADPKLNGEYSLEAFDLVLKLALSCTGLKQERPSMEQVALRLQKALNFSTQAKPVASRGSIMY
ncbi:probable serine/threonine-protein kinase PBL1 [Durio zibethinus]|uniref:Probable serine/threonine-protein kinase PBL1 n=1 Tax=Durio zibethinus TaxID=66656 RepID=A0A6P5Y5B0_DURZI|nr:probable serine/threonine-protein kinase PBL1 [Durio zibethinus]